MSGFDPTWLDLREPADHRARNTQIRDACAAHFSSRSEIRVVDLGCGSGSNLRALAPFLPPRQMWRLVDHDRRLLDAARRRLAAWADNAASAPADGLTLERDGKLVTVEFVEADLARDVEAALPDDVDLVTAAALFDLVSESWMRRLCGGLGSRPLYTVLTYNGLERWRPADPRDAQMLAAFHAHQGRDKGFGPSVGPKAATILAGLLVARGYKVSEGESDWRLTRGDGALVQALADGFAAACRETGLVERETVDGWREARRNAEVDIGHTDLFAVRI